MIARYLEGMVSVNWQWIALGGEFMATFTLFIFLSYVIQNLYKSGFGFQHLSVLEGNGKDSLQEPLGKSWETSGH